MNKEKIILIFLILTIFILNYATINAFLIKSFQNYEVGIVTRVVDGDTIIVNNESVRMLGINTPEKKEKYSAEAKRFLENELLDKEVHLYFGKEKYDLYKRKLAYVYYKNENINKKIIENGFANFYFPSGKDKYYFEFKIAWENCINKNINLCEKSSENCIKLTAWDTENQKIILKNECNKKIDLTNWTIKDEGRKKYTFQNKIIFPNESITLTKENWNETYVWTKTGDTIFIRDSDVKIVYWENY